MNNALNSVTKFQFHKGTIRTRQRLLGKLGKRHFNSIKVQLEPLQTQRQRLFFLTFQFHKGTIRTDVRMLRFTSIEYFNSIKVQLELNCSTLLTDF